MLLPPDLRDGVRRDHIVHFIIDAVDSLPAEEFLFNRRGTGDEQYPPRMMLSLLIYCYATGRFSSRGIENATHEDVAVRYICGGDLHPDHDTLCTFRRKNRKLFEKAFVEVLLMAQESAGLRKVGTVSVDGTKIKANASKHSAVSYKHAGEQIELLRKEVEQLTAKAERIDNVPLDDGLSIPDEIVRRKERIKSLKQAREVIETRDEEERVQKQAEYEKKTARREKMRSHGKKPRGKEPQPPSEKPPDKNQYNFTDPPNDKQQLNPVLESIPAEVANPENVLADTGYYSEEAVKKAEADNGPTVYCAMAKSGHHISVADLEKKPIAIPPPLSAPMKEQMTHRLKTPEGKALYKQRKQTVEPVFGVIKEVLGFRRFSMRGKEKAETEWCLVCLSYNLKKIFKLMGACVPKRPVRTAKQHARALWAHFWLFSEAFSCAARMIRHDLESSFIIKRSPSVLTPTGC